MATETTPVPEADGDEFEAPAAPRFQRERLSALLRRRHRLMLGLILVLAAFCNFYELQREGFANLYYSAAVRSMLGEPAQLLLCIVRSRRLCERG